MRVEQSSDVPPDDAARRRAYWQSEMERAFETQAAMRKYSVEECGEGFVSIPDGMIAAGLEVQFSETRIAGTFERLFYIRESLLSSLVSIAREMNGRGWALRIEEGFRTMDMQRAPAPRPLRPSSAVAPGNRGRRCRRPIWSSGGPSAWSPTIP